MTTTVQPENIARLRGNIKLQPEFIDQWRQEIRSSRDQSVKESPEIASVYRSDASDLLMLATLLKRGGKASEIAEVADGFDSNVRELVPNNVWDMLHPDN